MDYGILVWVAGVGMRPFTRALCEKIGKDTTSLLLFALAWLWATTNGIPFWLVGAPPISEPILVGIGMFTGGRGLTHGRVLLFSETGQVSMASCASVIGHQHRLAGEWADRQTRAS